MGQPRRAAGPRGGEKVQNGPFCITPKRRSWLLLDKGGKESNLVCDSCQGASGLCHHVLDGVIATSQSWEGWL